MEERKTAVVVLSIIALIFIALFYVMPKKTNEETQTVSFKGCAIHFNYFEQGLEADIERAANNKLALCLCDTYRRKLDSSISNRIIQIYRKYNMDSDSARINNNLDSIIKYRKTVLDTLILLD